MKDKNPVFSQSLSFLLGQVICVSIMLGLFYLLGKFDRSVLLGGILGGLMASANFFFMAMGTSLAADRAEAQNTKGGMAIIRASQLIRYILLFVILAVLIKSGLTHPLATVLPLAFQWPILLVSEFFRKERRKEHEH